MYRYARLSSSYLSHLSMLLQAVDVDDAYGASIGRQPAYADLVRSYVRMEGGIEGGMGGGSHGMGARMDGFIRAFRDIYVHIFI